jgi:hypothetical protein
MQSWTLWGQQSSSRGLHSSSSKHSHQHSSVLQAVRLGQLLLALLLLAASTNQGRTEQQQRAHRPAL